MVNSASKKTINVDIYKNNEPVKRISTVKYRIGLINL